MVIAAYAALAAASSLGQYNARAWYWDVAGQIYSSASNTYVAASDPGYATWAENNTAVVFANEAELWDVIHTAIPERPAWLFDGTTFVQPTPTTYSKVNLGGYAADARWRKNTGGIVVNGTPFPTDSLSLGALNSAFIYGQSNVGATFQWKLPDGSFVTLTKAQVEALQGAVSEFGQACFQCESDTVAAIDVGTITTLEAIDAAFAAVSNEFTPAASADAFRNRRVRRR